MPFHVAGWFLTPTTAITIPVGKYAAITRNTYGKGEVTYVGFMPSDALTEKIVEESVRREPRVDRPQRFSNNFL